MILDQTIDRAVSNFLIKEQEKERANHISSGKLSAGQLGKPLQWQMLKVLGVPGKPQEEYTLRFFERGKSIETWLIDRMPNVLEQQKEVEYRGVIGYIDTVIDTKDYESKVGIIPTEIKSVKNSKYARILVQGQPDRGHALQACLYALAEKKDYFGIAYIAADDLRLTHWIIKTENYAQQVDDIINKFNDQMAKKVLPAFEPIEKWQATPQYSDYPDWQELTEEECMLKLASEYPDQYQKLVGKLK